MFNMKELLYIPSGRYVKFFKIPYDGSKFPTESIENYLIQHRKFYRYESDKFLTIGLVIEKVSEFYLTTSVYDYAEIPLEQEKPIPLIYFELVDTD